MTYKVGDRVRFWHGQYGVVVSIGQTSPGHNKHYVVDHGHRCGHIILYEPDILGKDRLWWWRRMTLKERVIFCASLAWSAFWFGKVFINLVF